MVNLFDSIPSPFGDPNKALRDAYKPASSRPLAKHQKRRLIACDVPDCFHPAHFRMDMGDKTVNVCDCHYIPDPHPCRETIEQDERRHHIKDGECAFCKTDRARNAIHGLTDNVIFLCDRCYHTPMSELGRYYKQR